MALPPPDHAEIAIIIMMVARIIMEIKIMASNAVVAVVLDRENVPKNRAPLEMPPKAESATARAKNVASTTRPSIPRAAVTTTATYNWPPKK